MADREVSCQRRLQEQGLLRGPSPPCGSRRRWAGDADRIRVSGIAMSVALTC